MLAGFNKTTTTIDDKKESNLAMFTINLVEVLKCRPTCSRPTVN